MQANYFVGSGEVYAELVNGKLLPLFNCSAAKITQSENETTLKNYMSTAGGNIAKISRLDKVNVELTIHSMNKENLGFVLRGRADAFVAGSVTDVEYVAHADSLVRVAHVGVTDVVVKDSAGLITYVAGVDYVVKGAGVYILASGDISEGSTIKVSYDYAAQNAVQALTESQRPMKVVIDGLNAANSGSATVIDVHKVAFGFADALDFIGDEFAAIQIKGEALADTSVPAGDSPYYKVTILD